MINLDQAIEIALADAGEGMAASRDAVVEKTYGWVIFPNTKEYIESGDWRKSVLGRGGVLVLKSNGRIIHFGSKFGLEQNLDIYELGYFDHACWDIVVTEVMDEDAAIDLLVQLGASYVKTELEGGVVWKIPQKYTTEQITKMIQGLPLRLTTAAQNY